MINSHLLYRLSYRGTTARMLLIKKEKSTLHRDIYVVRIRVFSDGVVGGALAAMAASPARFAAGRRSYRLGGTCGVCVGAPPRVEALAFAVLCRTIRG